MLKQYNIFTIYLEKSCEISCFFALCTIICRFDYLNPRIIYGENNQMLVLYNPNKGVLHCEVTLFYISLLSVIFKSNQLSDTLSNPRKLSDASAALRYSDSKSFLGK